MQDVLLLITVAVTIVFGWFVMGKVDCFFEAADMMWYNEKTRRNPNGNTKAGPGSAFKSNPK